MGITLRDALMDALVHSQDIAIPLGRDLPLPTDAAAGRTQVWSVQGSALSTVFRRLPLRHLRLVATDTDWAVSGDPLVTGPIRALLLRSSPDAASPWRT